MRNKILEEVIDTVIDNCDQPPEFIAAFKKLIINKFNDNADEDDLKTVWSLISIQGEADL